MSSTQKTVLITGANRGIGFGFAQDYANKGYKVIATVRDLSRAPKIPGVITVKIDASNDTDPYTAVEELKTKHGIEKLDIVIANAGISEHYALVRDIDLDQFDQHHKVNARAPLILFKAIYPLLEQGSKFVVISTFPSQNGVDHFPNFGAYGASKATVNYITRQIHFEEPSLTAFFISPGWLDTDMGNAGAAANGLDAPPEKLSVTLPQMVDLIDKSTREEHSGYMWNYDGTKIPF
ncbi:uncharacterized protein IL334_001765 [Kwoniella shivajii]|uniref:NAD(P)-binding protein n=1 Tax=Kwoniella shivajii TaxID=564305 RepID=A0ABZ1CU15_9TREE|nr:hypothetical protein IL334_001765 [Kwoniella shivajii]